MFGVTSRRNWGQASKSAVLVESHRMCLLPSAVRCDSCGSREAIGDSAERFLCWGWVGRVVHRASLYLSTHQNSRLPQKENRCLAQTMLFAQFSHSEPPLPVLGIELSRNLKFADTCQGQPCKLPFLRIAVRPAVFILSLYIEVYLIP